MDSASEEARPVPWCATLGPHVGGIIAAFVGAVEVRLPEEASEFVKVLPEVSCVLRAKKALSLLAGTGRGERVEMLCLRGGSARGLTHVDFKGVVLGSNISVAALLAPESRVRKLTLAGSAIHGAALAETFSALANNTALQSLDAGNRGIRTAHHPVRTLGMDQSAAVALGTALRENSTLKHLGFHRTSFTEQNLAAIAAGVSTNTGLCTLDLSDCNIGACDTQETSNWIVSLHTSRVKVLELSSNSLSAPSVRALVQLLRSSSTLTELDIGSITLPCARAQEAFVGLLDSLRDNLRIKTLRVAHASFADASTALAAQRLLAENRMLELIELSGTHGGAAPERLLPVLRGLASNVSLTALQAPRILDQQDPGSRLELAEVFGRVVQLHPTLRDINLSRNALLEASVGLANGIHSASALQSLNLKGCLLCPNAAFAFSRALQRDCSLVSLDLSFCGLGVEGVTAVIHGLRENTRLATLNLSGNVPQQDPPDDGTQVICVLAETLMKNTSLRGLSLRLNFWRAGSVMGKLIWAARRNVSLRYLRMSPVLCIKTEHLADLSAAIAHRPGVGRKAAPASELLVPGHTDGAQGDDRTGMLAA